MFEPAATGRGPSGLADWPRPFVFRAAHLDGCAVPPGSTFHFDFHFFDMRHPAMDAIARAFAKLADAGLGPGRGRADLTAVSGDRPITLALDPRPEPIRHVSVRFLTPTELKVDGKLAQAPEFGLLAARICDRLSTLRALYDCGPLEVDFRAFRERAARVRMTRCGIRQIDVNRRSRRTGQTHPIGGFVGEAEYQGDLAEFLPYLEAARWTGVGRQTAWGKGVLEVAAAQRPVAESP
jgi:hypothetical protein